MTSPDWYAGWRHDAVHRLQDQNEALEQQFKMGSWPRYDYDLATRLLTFSEHGRAKVVAEIQVVGSISHKAGNWLWAWANAHWPADCIEDAQCAYSFGEEHGIGELTDDYVEHDDLTGLGWAFAAVTARICNAKGAYRPPSEDGALFLVFREVRWVI